VSGQYGGERGRRQGTSGGGGGGTRACAAYPVTSPGALVQGVCVCACVCARARAPRQKSEASAASGTSGACAPPPSFVLIGHAASFTPY